MTTPSTVYVNTTVNHLADVTGDGKDFFHHLNATDETAFIALILLGVVVPSIFLSVFALLCIRRHKEKKARRAEMLLRDVQDVAMDYPSATIVRNRDFYI